jgi:hypothetical protein
MLFRILDMVVLMQLGEASADEAFKIRYFPFIIDRPGLYMVHFSAYSLNLILEGFGAEVSSSLFHWQ